MKKNWKDKMRIRFQILDFSFQIGVMLVVLLAACETKDGKDHSDTYTCPMHSTVVADRPGTCPVCGMELVKKGRPGEEVKITGDLARLIKSPNGSVVSSIKTIKGEYKALSSGLKAQGIVTYDPRNLFTISSRTGGRLEKVYLKYAFQSVRKGDKIAEIYSPELITAQRELIFLIENDSRNELLINDAKQRLRLLGLTEGQINTLVQRKQTQNTVTIYSPYDGYIISTTQQIPSAPVPQTELQTSGSSGMNDPMSSTRKPSNTSSTDFIASEDLIREGSYAVSGQALFRVVDISTIRIEFNLPPSTGKAVRKGSVVKIDLGNDATLNEKIDFIQPFFSDGQEFLTVRVDMKNISHLPIGKLVDARFEGISKEGLWVPREAVVDLGINKIVFVKDKQVLKPKQVQIGARTDDAIEITQGLSSSEEIAASAQFMVDSESFIKIQQ